MRGFEGGLREITGPEVVDLDAEVEDLEDEDEESFERGRVLRLLQSESTAVDLAAEPLEEVQSVPPIEAAADPDEVALLRAVEDDE